MFNSKPATTTEPTNLPEGYDDAESPLYVPEPLREFYAATPSPASSPVSARMDEFALQQASAEGKAKYERKDERGDVKTDYPQMESYRGELRKRADAIKEADYDNLRALAVHRLRLESAAITMQAHDRRAEDRARMIADQTCPRCHQFDIAINGLVDTRDLFDEQGHRAHRPFRSCFACYSVKRAQMLTRWSVNRLPDGRTRGEAVAER
jgi:hypothetical protein